MGLFMGIFLHGFFRPFIFFIFPSYSHSPPDGFGNNAGRPLAGASRAYFRDLYCFQSRSSAACLTRRPCLVCHYSSRSISCPACQGRPQAESLTGRWAGSWRALWGGYGCVLPALLVCTFQGTVEREVFSPFTFLPKKGPSEYPYAANFSKYFFRSRRIRSRRLITARWVTPMRRAYSLVERWS